jgi:nucleoside-diphosphate-sugar epimerase
MGQRICVTGASGQAGRAVARDLREHGYDVVATDAIVSRPDRQAGMLRADLTDFGQAVEMLRGADAVVHLANIPAPGLETPAVTFNSNITMNYNVFSAAASLGLSRVVWASSETTLGLPFDVSPRYAPVDERDVAAAGRLALSAAADTVAGSPSFIIAAADTVMNRPSADLLAEVFPEVKLTREVGEFGTLLAIDRARAVLGFEPAHSWRDHVTADAAPTAAEPQEP